MTSTGYDLGTIERPVPNLEAGVRDPTQGRPRGLVIGRVETGPCAALLEVVVAPTSDESIA